MAQYRVLQKSFIDSRLVEAGETVEYDGEASDNLELIKKATKRTAATTAAADEGDAAASEPAA